ncbi:MAG: hypothetical protein IH963_05020 [Chloroflexi bacterium]|nr:hypothetical protein [Chloroflexota bacterium]
MFKRAFLAGLVVLGASSSLNATTYYVDATCGFDSNNGLFPSPTCSNILPNGPKRTIQAAINVASNGDTIIVADGTYSGANNYNLDFGGLDLTVRSESGDPATCIIDCASAGRRAFIFQSGETSASLVDGFKITGCLNSDGGGMRISGASPTINNCEFIGNDANGDGGGIFVTGAAASPSISNCVFISNTAVQDGGAICNAAGATPSVTDCVFSGNTAFRGGAVVNFIASNATFDRCLFTSNQTSGGNGGAMANDTSHPTLTDCTFSFNSAIKGGAMLNNKSDPVLRNCLIRDNSAVDGAGFANLFDSSPQLINCTFFSNDASGEGGGMFNDGSGSDPTVVNTIFWADTAVTAFPEIREGTGTTTISFSDIAGSGGGGNNLDVDPAFVFASPNRFALQSTSPCIDAGSNAAVPVGVVTDLGGADRIVDGNDDAVAVVDMGAYEFLPPVHNVTQNLYHLTIQGAINAAAANDEIEVDPGTYNEVIDFGGLAVRLASVNGAAVTIIDGVGLNDSVVKCVTGEGLDTIFEGFTIRGGQTANNQDGGGMKIDNSSPTVQDCIFSSNEATTGSGRGGGIFIWGGSPKITRCTLKLNEASRSGGGLFSGNGGNPEVTFCIFDSNRVSAAGSVFGGGMFIADGNPKVEDCTFESNSATTLTSNLIAKGGGLYNGSSATITNCRFLANRALGSPANTSAFGAGVYSDATGAKYVGCEFIGNDLQLSSTTRGAGIYLNASATLTNCTLYSNTASGNSIPQGGGIYRGFGPSYVRNSIFRDNTPDQIYEGSGNVTVSYSNVQGGWPGTTNINKDPLFVDEAADDLRLSRCSPSVDAGNSALVPVGVTTDVAGNPRFVDDVV